MKLRSRQSQVPFNYQSQLTGAIHKWIGKNDIHDKASLYSFSWLQGGRQVGNHLVFTDGALWVFNSHDPDLIKKLVRGIEMDPSINFGLSVSDILLQETPQFSDKEVFHVSSPVLVKRRTGDKDKHYTYDDPESDIFLTETLKTKLAIAGIACDNIFVKFQRNYPLARTKIIYYKDIGNKVNLCPVEISGPPEAVAFAWNCGVGNSTGVGFGALK